MKFLFWLLCLLPVVGFAATTTFDGGIDKIERELEVARYQRLGRIQADPHNHLARFATDGCSGGLSDGWRFLARTLPPFKQEFGSKPPYESCCVTHDHAYWRGDTVQGFEKRKQADAALRQCVILFGKAHREEFVRRFHLPTATIERNFRIVAAIMYRAVRVGGICPARVCPGAGAMVGRDARNKMTE